MKYTISDIARLLGISLVTMRNYEKSGLLEPKRNEKNQYRQYDAIDMNLVRRVRHLMGYGFSLNEASRLLLNEPLSGLAEALNQKEADLQRQLMLDYYKLTYIQEQAARIHRLAASPGECFIENSPAFYGFVYRQGVRFNDLDQSSDHVRAWNCCPFAETLLRFPHESFLLKKMTYETGLCIEERYLTVFDAKSFPDVVYFPSKRSVFCLVPTAFEPDISENDFCYSHMISRINQKGLTITGDPIARVIHTSKSTGEWLHYTEMWVPIE